MAKTEGLSLGKASEQGEKQDLQSSYPALEVAYDLVLPSYEWALRRLDAIDARLRHIATLAASITAAVPVAMGALTDYVIFSPWFVAGVAIGVATIVLSTYAQTAGGLILVDPAKVRPALTKTPDEFRDYLVYYAGCHRARNGKVINSRGYWAMGLSGLVALEIALLTVWVVQTI